MLCNIFSGNIFSSELNSLLGGFLMKISRYLLKSILAISCIWSKLESPPRKLVIVQRKAVFHLRIPNAGFSVGPNGDTAPVSNKLRNLGKKSD